MSCEMIDYQNIEMGVMEMESWSWSHLDGVIGMSEWVAV